MPALKRGRWIDILLCHAAMPYMFISHILRHDDIMLSRLSFFMISPILRHASPLFSDADAFRVIAALYASVSPLSDATPPPLMPSPPLFADILMPADADAMSRAADFQRCAEL